MPTLEFIQGPVLKIHGRSCSNFCKFNVRLLLSGYEVDIVAVAYFLLLFTRTLEGIWLNG